MMSINRNTSRSQPPERALPSDKARSLLQSPHRNVLELWIIYFLKQNSNISVFVTAKIVLNYNNLIQIVDVCFIDSL